MLNAKGLPRLRSTLLATVTTASLLVVLLPAPAVAHGHCEVVETGDGYRMVCEDGGNGNGNGNGNARPIRVEGYYSIVLRWAPEIGEDERCWELRFNPRPGTAPGEDGTWSYADAYAQGQESWGDRYPECPGNAGGPPDPTAAIMNVWTENQPVPDFGLDVAPGYALTGMPAYLEVHGDRQVAANFDLPAPFTFGVSLTASATYDIDWGDGSPVQTGVTSPGPWPDGEARHTYVHAEPVTVTVTAVWTGSWQAGPFGGDLPVLRRPQTHPLEVRQIQAVRVADG